MKKSAASWTTAERRSPPGPPCPARLRRLDGDRAEVTLERPEEGVAPGQACVFYQGEVVLGGGWILPQ